MKKTILTFCFSGLLSVLLMGQSNPYDITTKSTLKQDNDNRSTLVKQFPFLNVVDWKPGMRFMAEPLRDKQFSDLYKIKLSPYNSKNSYSAQIKLIDFQWKEFVYKGLELRGNKTFLIFGCGNDKYEFEFYGDTSKLREARVLNTIDKLVYIDEVDKVKELLINKSLYITTSQWMKDDKEGLGRYSFSNPKFVKVTIANVGLGSQDGPCKIVFKQIGNKNDEEYYLNIRFSGINKGVGVFGFDFDNVFSFEDPKLKYPNISDEIWEKIQNGKVKIGMTKEECELSWGKPKDINKTITSGILSEQWVYSTSSYLYFTNGKLESIQN